MSNAVRSYQASLFGREERSDCTVLFTLSDDQADRPSKRQRAEKANEQGIAAATGAPATGTSLPGHTLLLCPGSSYFAAQAERWSSQASRSGKPELRVPLGCAGDRPHAEAAIRFIYTNELGPGGPVELLHVRRLAAFLGVEGCVEACDAALLALAKAAGAAHLEAVGQLFECRQLLPQWDDDPAAPSLLKGLVFECRAQLARYTGADNGVQLPDGGSVALSKLLVWAFPDAPSVLNDPAAKTHVRALSSASLELLLGSNDFATDNEASVLLLLAEWLDANPQTTPAVRTRLCHLVRLCHLSSPYLHGILPLLGWLPLEPASLRCIQLGAGMVQEARDRYFRHMNEKFARIANWYVSRARPKPRPCMGYEWSITQDRLEAGLAETRKGSKADVAADLGGGAASLVAEGFDWDIRVRLINDTYNVCVKLVCSLPAALKLPDPREVFIHASPGPCRVTVWQWGPAGERSAAYQGVFGAPGDLAEAGCVYPGVGSYMALRLEPLGLGAGSLDGTDVPPPRSLALWAPYLRDGKLSGSVEWHLEQ